VRQISGLAAFVVLGGCAVAAMGRLPQSRPAAVEFLIVDRAERPAAD